MNIVFLNVWHGKVLEPLKKFLEKESKSTDIFCLTEVHPELRTTIQNILPDFEPNYTKLIRTKYLGGDIEGQTILVKKGIKSENYKSHLAFEINENDVGAVETVEIYKDGAKFTLASVHGMAQPGNKLDTEARINQSKKIIEIFKDVEGPKIIGGDFNLSPDTVSVRLFEDAGYRNLIKDFKIENTRNKLSWDQFENDPNSFGKQHFADYVFVSKDVAVAGFEVPYVEVSDHLPLILKVSI